MVKVFENEIVYDYPPAQTLAKLHTKYPNPFATHVQSVDTISRTIDPVTGVVRSERLIGVVQGAPRWITKLFSLPSKAYVREIIFVDPSVPSAMAMSMNLSLAQYVSCLELIRYLPHPSADGSHSPTSEPGYPGHGIDAKNTLFHQRAILTSAFPTAMIARRIEKASVDRFAANAGLGRQGFEWVLAGGQQDIIDHRS